MLHYEGINGFQIQQYTWDIIDSNSYLITSGTSGLLIDAIDSPELVEALLPIEDLTVILTHCHFDHICGLNIIRERIPHTIVYSSCQCSDNITSSSRNLSSAGNAFVAFYLNQGMDDEQKIANIDKCHCIEPFCCAPADKCFEGETSFVWQGHMVSLSQVYGHSSDSLIAVIDGKYIFSGDTLLPIPTVTRFPSGSTARFWKETVPRLKEMPVECVFPGHGSPGKLTDMLAVNQVPERYKK